MHGGDKLREPGEGKDVRRSVGRERKKKEEKKEKKRLPLVRERWGLPSTVLLLAPVLAVSPVLAVLAVPALAALPVMLS